MTIERRAENGENIPVRTSCTKVAFDWNNDAYCVRLSDDSTVLLHSRDRGATFTAWTILGTGSFDIE
ncbi:hypothetical protein LLG96_09925 [bacterium]|nr:hypothetical protein [bacterium]